MLRLAAIARRRPGSVEAACRAEAQQAYLGDHVALCRLLTRYKFYVDTRDTGFASHVMLDGYWESGLTRFVARVVKPGMVVADLGANYGYYTLLLADLVKSRGHVYAVEPNPAAATLLRRSVDLNGFGPRCSVVEACATSADGQSMSLFVPHGEPKNASIISSADIVSADAGVVHSVPGRTLDSITADRGPPDFVKIDAEGAEEDIFAGMSQMLKSRLPKIVLEFNVLRYPEPRTFIDKLTRYYDRLLYVANDGNAVRVTADRLLSEQVGVDWLLYLAK
jgi:FkbM family methyltransferase